MINRRSFITRTLGLLAVLPFVGKAAQAEPVYVSSQWIDPDQASKATMSYTQVGYTMDGDGPDYKLVWLNDTRTL